MVTWEIKDQGFWALAWVLYVLFAIIVSLCRYSVRQTLAIEGNAVQDFFLSLFFYPMVVAQVCLIPRTDCVF